MDIGDNFSSDVQPPSFYSQWSKNFYDKAIYILNKADKYIAVHIDGMLAGKEGTEREKLYDFKRKSSKSY